MFGSKNNPPATPFPNYLQTLFGPVQQSHRRTFTFLDRLYVWGKASNVPGYDPSVRRQDDYGNHIIWSEYGKANNKFGWEIDHIHPIALGGSNDLDNLRALQCKKNRSDGSLLNQSLNNGILTR